MANGQKLKSKNMQNNAKEVHPEQMILMGEEI